MGSATSPLPSCTDEWISSPCIAQHRPAPYTSSQGPSPTYTLQATVTKLKNTNCWCHKQYETGRASDRHIELLTYPTVYRTGSANFKHCGCSSRWWWHLEPSHSTRMMADNTKQICPLTTHPQHNSTLFTQIKYSIKRHTGFVGFSNRDAWFSCTRYTAERPFICFRELRRFWVW